MCFTLLCLPPQVLFTYSRWNDFYYPRYLLLLFPSSCCCLLGIPSESFLSFSLKPPPLPIDKPDISKTAHFDSFTPEDYNLFLKKKRERGEKEKRERKGDSSFINIFSQARNSQKKIPLLFFLSNKQVVSSRFEGERR